MIKFIHRELLSAALPLFRLCGLQKIGRKPALFPGRSKNYAFTLRPQACAHFGGTLLKLAFHFGRALTDIYGLAHCNERGRACADAGRTDNGDNLRWRDINRAAIWPNERNEQIEDRCENRCHILILSADRFADDRWHQLLVWIPNRSKEKPLEVGRSALL